MEASSVAAVGGVVVVASFCYMVLLLLVAIVFKRFSYFYDFNVNLHPTHNVRRTDIGLHPFPGFLYVRPTSTTSTYIFLVSIV
jgi:hypothetical protein